MKSCTIAPACADRSCGPPKPGAAYESQPDGAAGGPPRPQTGYFLILVADLGRRTGPRGLEMAAACQGVDSQDLATILEPFRAIFVDLGPDRLSAS